MTVKQIKEIAKQKDIKVGNMKKENIIRAIRKQKEILPVLELPLQAYAIR
jgi:hypothetical protein